MDLLRFIVFIVELIPKFEPKSKLQNNMIKKLPIKILNLPVNS